MSFHINAEEFVLSDINAKLINFYQVCKSSPHEMYSIYEDIPRDKETFYEIRRQFNLDISPLRSAAYFFYLNRNCFNGLYRTSLKGDFNVPYSSSRIGKTHTRIEFISLCEKFSTFTFSCLDFEKAIVNNLHPESFFFIDPPYAVNYRAPFTEYDSKSFGHRDMPRLLACLEGIDDVGALFVLTYTDQASRQLMLRRHWKISEISVQRHIAGFAGARRRAVEAVITNGQ